MIRGAASRGIYMADWFDPRTGEWSRTGSGRVTANVWGWITLPDFPSQNDWGLKLTLVK